MNKFLSDTDFIHVNGGLKRSDLSGEGAVPNPLCSSLPAYHPRIQFPKTRFMHIKTSEFTVPGV